MKKVFVFLAVLLFALGISAPVHSGGVAGFLNGDWIPGSQPSYVSGPDYYLGALYKYYPLGGGSGDGYRTLRLRTESEMFIDDIGWMVLISVRTAGDPNIVTILDLYQDPDTDPLARQWKVGEKTTVEELMKDYMNVSEYRIRTPSGYSVEFTGTGTAGMRLFNTVEDRKFGVILPNSEVRVASMGGTVWVDKGAIGWDDEFMYANNLDDYMKYIAEKVDYNKVKMLTRKADFDKLQTDKEKRDYCAGVVAAVAMGTGAWSAVWGIAPPWLIPMEFANVLAQFTARAYMAASIGYLYGHYPNESDFHQRLKNDNYVLYAGMDVGGLTADVVDEMTEDAVEELVQLATTAILLYMKASAPVIRSVPVVGTVYGILKGGYDGFTDAVDMGIRAVTYYSKGPPEFSFDAISNTIIGYNGINGVKAASVTVPDRIDKEVRFIQADVFQNNGILERITLGRNLRQIEAEAFSGCGKLTTVSITSNTRINTIGADAFKGTNLDFPSKAALRNLRYTGAGVGEGIFVVNNTGKTIAVIERKVGSTWSPVLTKSIKNGQKVDVDLAPGTYDLRLRTNAISPDGDIYAKENVTVTDGATGRTVTAGTRVEPLTAPAYTATSNTTVYVGTEVIFTALDSDKLTTEECKAFIQARCQFSNPANVWRAIDTHPFADALYRTWARSYPDIPGHRFPVAKPDNMSDKDIIQARCDFSSPQAVWDVVNKHSDPDALLRVWADSYYTKGGLLEGIGNIIGGLFGGITDTIGGLFGGHRYEVVNERMTWEEAKSEAERRGGYLATITSEKENAVVFDLTKQGNLDSYWLGGRADSNRTWSWITGERFTYTNWGSGQPDGGTRGSERQDWITIRPDSRYGDPGQWDDNWNTNRLGFVIEWNR